MSKQSDLWAGEFGDKYHERNESTDREEFWRDVCYGCIDVESVFEPGAGRGDNLATFKAPGVRLTGMDINLTACNAMTSRGILGLHGNFSTFNFSNRYDLVITRGFLIHIPTPELEGVLGKIYNLSNKYIAIAEYYSPTRRRLSYRGHKNAMWSGDYAGMLMDMHPDLELLRYGFKYGRVGGYDLTYFLMRKTK